MNRTKIPWVKNADGTQGYTWNPITGCSPASEGCSNCYAAAISKRFGCPWGAPVLHADRLIEPQKAKKPNTIFVCSMSDIFHQDAAEMWKKWIFERMAWSPKHRFIVLTKRADNMQLFFQNVMPVPENCWIGVTAENQARYDERVPILMSIQARVRFVSVEPMLGPVNPLATPLRPSWMIVGPENGPGARPCDPRWIDDIQGRCQRACIPFFNKRDHDGAVREMPTG